jgi:hypothetical protein
MPFAQIAANGEAAAITNQGRKAELLEATAEGS